MGRSREDPIEGVRGRRGRGCSRLRWHGSGLCDQRQRTGELSFGDLHEATLARGRPISSELAPELARGRDWMLSLSVERRSGAFVPGLEYRWTRGQQLLGSRRLFTGARWSDRVESNRTSKKHQLHARLRWRWKGQTVVGHYEWVHSYDNTDGPFSFPERQDDIPAEWARTSGVSPHNVSIVGSFQLPGRASLSLVWTSRSSSPYNVTSSRDIGRNGLYNDRGGRPRNTGKGPGFNSLSLFAHQRIRLPGFLSPSVMRAPGGCDRSSSRPPSPVEGAFVSMPPSASRSASMTSW